MMKNNKFLILLFFCIIMSGMLGYISYITTQLIILINDKTIIKEKEIIVSTSTLKPAFTKPIQ